MIYTTLNKIRDKHPCKDGWEKLLKHLGKTSADDDPLPLVTILDSNGLEDCLWCLRTVPEHGKEWRLFAVWCARKVQHLMTDPRSIAALDVAERYAMGNATDEELFAARDAAEAAAEYSAWTAAGAVARVAARATAEYSAWTAAGAAARATAGATAEYAARATAWDAARAAAWDAARFKQKTELRRILEETT